MQQAPEALESIALRRAQLVDADKVRYRVYKTPTEFVAVIAESALLAMKMAGVKRPHRIVRDLPTEGIAIEAERIEKISDTSEMLHIAPVRKEAMKQRLVADIGPKRAADAAKPGHFKPLTLGDLQRAGLNRPRILSPQLVSEIIDEYSKASAEPPPSPEEVEPVNAATPVTAPLPSAEPEEGAAAAPVAPPPPPPVPEPSQEEKLLQLAAEVLPSAKDLPASDQPALSPDEVSNLLNE